MLDVELNFDTTPSPNTRVALSLAQTHLSKALSIEEAFWKQKAASKWLIEGERNTKFFHNMVNKRRVSNKIYRIWDGDDCLENPLHLQEYGARFF